MKPYLHIGSGAVLGPSWHSLDGNLNLIIGILWRKHGWVNDKDEMQVWFGRSRLLRGLFTLALLQYTRLFDKESWPLQIHDLRKPLPFKENTFQAAYSSHVMEHLHRQEAARLLVDIKRVLVPGGIMRVVVPDLRSFVRDYLDDVEHNPPDGAAAERLNQRLLFHPASPVYGNRVSRFRASTDFFKHKWMYDTDSLCLIVKQAGYDDVRPCDYLESQIPVIGEIEKPDRLLNGAGVCVEAVKPK